MPCSLELNAILKFMAAPIATTVILLRHGETLSNIKMIYQGQGNSALSPCGKNQAKLVSDFLKKTEIDFVYSSDLTRSYVTASIIGKPHRLKPTKVRALRERYYGKWEGMRFDAIQKKYKDLYATWEINPGTAVIPGAEKLEELQDRGIKAIEKIVKRHKGKTILIVGHGGINRAILFKYLNLELNNFWRVKQDNCCLNVIKFSYPYPRVALMNSTFFLGEKRLFSGNSVLA